MPKKIKKPVLYETLQKIIHGDFREFQEQLVQIWETALLPVLASALVLFIAMGVYQYVYRRYIRPRRAVDYHYEALDNPQRAPALLRKALQADPSYTPARTALAALQLYQDKDATTALQTLRSCPVSEDRTAMERDARVLLDGHGSMIQYELRKAIYLAIPQDYVESENSSALGSSKKAQ